MVIKSISEHGATLWIIFGSYIPHPVVEFEPTRSATSRRTVRPRATSSTIALSATVKWFPSLCTLIALRTGNGPSTAPGSFPNTKDTPHHSKRASTNSYVHLTQIGRTSWLSLVGHTAVRRRRLAILAPRHPRVTRWPVGARIRHGRGKMVKFAQNVWNWPFIFREVSNTGECEGNTLQ